jgi:hypothetical protein
VLGCSRAEARLMLAAHKGGQQAAWLVQRP